VNRQEKSEFFDFFSRYQHAEDRVLLCAFYCKDESGELQFSKEPFPSLSAKTCALDNPGAMTNYLTRDFRHFKCDPIFHCDDGARRKRSRHDADR
jgi:hypothetical protein